jgi:hypothetical protein
MAFGAHEHEEREFPKTCNRSIYTRRPDPFPCPTTSYPPIIGVGGQGGWSLIPSLPETSLLPQDRGAYPVRQAQHRFPWRTVQVNQPRDPCS